MSFYDKLYSRLIFQSGVGFVYRQLFMHAPPIPTGTRLTGQTAVITGSNTGLGFEAGRQLLQLDLSRLILAVRSQAKGNAAAEVLRNEFPRAQIDAWILDMENYESIMEFSRRCTTLGRIDVVILNAAVQNSGHCVSAATGKEQTFQVNYLSTMILSVLLLPILQAKGGFSGQPARLTVVTSTTAYFADFDRSKPIFPQFDKAYDVTKWYSREKLLLMIFMRKLAGLVDPDEVIINSVCPGLVGGTEIWRSLNTNVFLRCIFATYFVLFGRSLQEGASTYIHAVVIGGKETHAKFLSDWGVRP